MQLVARISNGPVVDPIAWVRVELRGARPANGGPIDVVEASADAREDGRAIVRTGTFVGALDPVQPRASWHTGESSVGDGVDPSRAMREARLGVAELVATVEGAVPFLARFARPLDAVVPREADSVEVVVRRASGEQERFVVLNAAMPAALGDALSATRHMTSVARAYFRNDPTS